MKYLKNPIILYGVIIVLFLLEVGTITYFLLRDNNCPVCEDNLLFANVDAPVDEEEEEKKLIYVDVKGYVKKPGVYEVSEGAIVNDVIKLAGGLKSNGTTDNINLSKKLTDETMIVVLSKSELKKMSSCDTVTNNIVTSTDQTSNSTNTVAPSNNKISINNATKDELMTLSGIGEKTAEKIIEYRSTQKFEIIDDIKKVSGIGDSLFEKIKDLITI